MYRNLVISLSFYFTIGFLTFLPSEIFSEGCAPVRLMDQDVYTTVNAYQCINEVCDGRARCDYTIECLGDCECNKECTGGDGYDWILENLEEAVMTEIGRYHGSVPEDLFQECDEETNQCIIGYEEEGSEFQAMWACVCK